MENSSFSNFKHRGMLLEKIINKTIDYYKKNKIAFFAKKNLDIKFKSVKKEINQKQVVESFLSKKSTVDYYGIYQGKYITFEAKSTDDKTFYLNNIQNHQYEHLKFIDYLRRESFCYFNV